MILQLLFYCVILPTKQARCRNAETNNSVTAKINKSF